MKRYWFYGSMPKNTIEENNLTQEQIQTINKEKQKINNQNYDKSWIGFKNGDGWDFMRHGFEVIYVNEEKGNIARDIFYRKIKEIFYK